MATEGPKWAVRLSAILGLDSVNTHQDSPIYHILSGVSQV